MIIVHNTFNCKPGNASKLAKLFKEYMGGMADTLHIMTDMTGEYHRVIVLSQYESLAAYEKSFENHMADTEENRKMNEAFKGMNEMYVSGSREIYKAW
jgi:heme-degrading monooxygenase HmoA